MQQSLVLSIIGPDRPGLVESVAQAAAAHGGNWLESHLARLAGQFAGVVHLQVPDDQVAALEAELNKLADQQLTVVAHRIDGAAPDADGRALSLELLGHDRPGIVRDIAQALAAAGVNVTELQTETFSAPMSGDPMFRATALLTAPGDADLETLGNTLRATAERLDLELEIEAAI